MYFKRWRNDTKSAAISTNAIAIAQILHHKSRPRGIRITSPGNAQNFDDLHLVYIKTIHLHSADNQVNAFIGPQKSGIRMTKINFCTYRTIGKSIFVDLNLRQKSTQFIDHVY
jgi:hypothetical protein